MCLQYNQINLMCKEIVACSLANRKISTNISEYQQISATNAQLSDHLYLQDILTHALFSCGNCN